MILCGLSSAGRYSSLTSSFSSNKLNAIVVSTVPSLFSFRMSRKRHVKERLSHRKPKTNSGKRELADVEVGELMTDEEVGLAIAEGLMERKPELIGKIRWMIRS